LNTVPPDATLVQATKIETLITQVGLKLGMSDEDAALWAELLTLNDLRGVFSHGSMQVANYVRIIREKQINPRPRVTIVNETESTLVVDGDGGLGYFAAHRAVRAVIEKGLKQGIAAALTRNHGHIGAAGLYSRLPLEHGLACIGTSGHRLNLTPGASIMGSAGGSPMTFAIPAGDEPPLVLDFGAMHDLYAGPEQLKALIESVPGLVLRAIGIGAVCQSLGGLLAGIATTDNSDRSKIGPSDGQYPGANQGSLFIVLDISRFIDLDRFKHDMDDYVRRTRRMQPLPGQTWAGLAGGLEWQRERDWRSSGVPMSKAHLAALAKVASEVGASFSVG
jgi:L-2-hydroxycarboxylate dehydrogenase (NAD+)